MLGNAAINLTTLYGAVGIVVVIMAIVIWRLSRRNRPKKEFAVEPTKSEKPHDSKGTKKVPLYRTFVIRQEGAKFENLPEKKGYGTVTANTTMAHSGECYLAQETNAENKDLIACEPRKLPIVSGETPQDMYDANDWRVRGDVYISEPTAWEKVQVWMGYVALFLLFITSMVFFDKLGK